MLLFCSSFATDELYGGGFTASTAKDGPSLMCCCFGDAFAQLKGSYYHHLSFLNDGFVCGFALTSSAIPTTADSIHSFAALFRLSLISSPSTGLSFLLCQPIEAPPHLPMFLQARQLFLGLQAAWF
jgi:hypothetical protein